METLAQVGTGRCDGKGCMPIPYASSARTRALALVTRTPSALALEIKESSSENCPTSSRAQRIGCTHFSRISIRFLLLTLCAISAAKEALCMRRSSTSLTLLTTSLRYPFGMMCRVFLFEP